MCEVEHRSERSNETEPSATMLAPSNDWQPSDPCSSSQSSRPMDEYVPSIYSAAWKFRIETFFRIIDTLITECKERTAAYSIVNLRFRFLTEFHDMSVAAVEEESKAFVSVYGSDVDDSFPNEMMHFIEFIGKEKTNAQQMLSTILKANVISTFPNVTTALRIYLSLMCTNCSGERSFSRLAL